MAEAGRYADDFLANYCEYTKHMEAPREFHLWTGISMIAGALQGKCYISQKFFKWKPNCFIIFVAPPGVVAKSTTSGVGTDIMRKVKSINFGPSSTTWQALLGKFAEVEQKYMIHGKSVPMANLTLEGSELGTLVDFNDDAMIDVLVDLWDGKDKPLVRRTQGGGETVIQSPWVNMIACTTPSWVQRNLNSYSIGGGFTSRTIFVYAEHKAKAVAYPGDHVPKNHDFLRKRLVDDLTEIAKLSGEFVLTADAKEYGTKWYEEFTLNKPVKLSDPRIDGYCARKQTHLHKISMCISASRGSDRIITREHMETAMVLLDTTELNLLKVFDNISDDRAAAEMSVIKKKLISLKAKRIEKKLLFRALSAQMGWDAFERAVNGTQLAGYCKLVQTKAGLEIEPNRKLLNGWE